MFRTNFSCCLDVSGLWPLLTSQQNWVLEHSPVLAPLCCVNRIYGSALMKLNIEIRVQQVFCFYPVWFKKLELV